MKHCLLPLLLALALALSPALAAEESAGFADVGAEDWFAPYVAVCADAGVMVGTGDGEFSPEKALSTAECLTLALRLYDLQRGGDGALEQAPEDWNHILWTLADGTVLQGGQNGPFVFYSFRRDGNADAHLSLTLTEEQEEWGKSLDGKASTVALNGQVYAGTVRCWEPAGDGVWVLSFYPDRQEGGAAIRQAMQANTSPAPGVWYRDAIYTGQAWGLDGETTPGFAALLEHASDGACFRGKFAQALADAAGALEKRYDVADLPDLGRDGNEAIYALYEAGILNGMDQYGTFQGDKPLTRAEAAAMVARVLDESLRLDTAPAALPERAYTLTGTDLGPWEIDGPDGAAAGFLPAVTRDENEAIRESAIYRADAVVFSEELEGGFPYSGEKPGYCADTRYVTLLRFDEAGNSQYARFDVETGTIVVPYQDYEGYLAQAQAFQAPLPLYQWDEGSAFPVGRDRDGNAVIPCLWDGRYYNEDRVPITEAFDWAGPVDETGAGFVQRDGQVYRIQF